MNCITCGHSQSIHIIDIEGIYEPYCGQLSCRCKYFVENTGIKMNETNQDLIQRAKNLHGELYHKINSLQRDLNIANAEVERLKNLSFSSSERVEITKTFERALKLLNEYPHLVR